MRLTTQTDYSLRMLMFLAYSDDRLVTISEVAEHYQISRNHLMKVAHVLGQDGFIETVRGRSGGLRLARPPAEINLGEIVRLLERDSVLVECFQKNSTTCLITPACRLKKVLADVMESFCRVLDEHTLADLVYHNEALSRLLKAEAA